MQTCVAPTQYTPRSPGQESANRSTFSQTQTFLHKTCPKSDNNYAFSCEMRVETIKWKRSINVSTGREWGQPWRSGVGYAGRMQWEAPVGPTPSLALSPPIRSPANQWRNSSGAQWSTWSLEEATHVYTVHSNFHGTFSLGEVRTWFQCQAEKCRALTCLPPSHLIWIQPSFSSTAHVPHGKGFLF